MNRNQKIAIGCGGAGCLGLIVLAVVGVVGYFYMNSSSSLANRNSNLNFNTSLNTNSDDNSTANSNAAADDSSSSSMSDDDKHKLFQAAGITHDSQLILKVLNKIGFPSGTGEEYEKFSQEHFSWAMKNLEFMQSVNTPEKGRAYVEAHLDD
ncbi:MAG TPA: hypothetical protein VFH15_14085 [Pyrinomonadaceae bacterium]|nr:hypothetical protein [Pyrinomonadaceae bacterium]